MSQVIPISQVNVTPQSNVFEYKFPAGSQRFRDRKIAIANMIIPYAWYNISTGYLNSTGLSMIFPTGATTQTITITIPNGFYTITQLNSYLQSLMVANKFYLVNGSTNLYYLEIVANVNTGTAQLNCYQCPTTTNYTNPGWTLPTTPNQVPQLVINNAEFGKLIGFAPATFPSNSTQAQTYSVLSSFTPQISPVSSLYVCLSCVNNELSSPNNIVSVVPINATYGAQIVFNPPQFIWVKALDGTLSSIALTLYDQNMRALPLNDTNLTANILVQ
jgi:hypothetical protein